MNRHGVDIKKTTPHRQGRIQDFGKGGINPDYDMKTVERSEAKKILDDFLVKKIL